MYARLHAGLHSMSVSAGSGSRELRAEIGDPALPGVLRTRALLTAEPVDSPTHRRNYGINLGSTMKTAISIEDGLLREADEAAKLLGLSRSGLFAAAVGEFLARQNRERMLLKLNQVYGTGADATETELLPKIKAKVRGAIKDKW